MLEIPHVIVGITINTIIPNPIISSPLILLSHFTLDKIPHWNPKPTRASIPILVFDMLLAVLVSGFFAYRLLPDIWRSITILLSCLLSILPDIVQIPYYFLNLRPNILKRFVKFQTLHQEHVSFKKGILSQVLITIIGLILIFIKSNRLTRIAN